MSEFTIRRMNLEDASGIARLTKAVWDDKYPVPELYAPDEIIELDKTGKALSVVAVDENGKVVAHDALESPRKGGVGECGQAMVHPDYQGHGLMLKTRSFIVEFARDLGLLGLYGQPVTIHVKSQKVYEKLGFKIIGVSPALLPSSVSLQATDVNGERKTLLMYFMKLKPLQARTIYLPDSYKETVMDIYNSLDVKIRFGEENTEAVSASSFEREYESPCLETVSLFKSSFIRFRELSEKSVMQFKELSDKVETDVLFLEFPCQCPEAIELCLNAETKGFEFAGIGVAFLGGADVVRMVRLKDKIDISLLQIENPMALRLMKRFQK